MFVQILESFSNDDGMLKLLISPIVTVTFGTFIIQYLLLPSKQKKEQLNNQLNEYHKKYFKIMDQLLNSRLKLVQSFDKCSSTHKELIKITKDSVFVNMALKKSDEILKKDNTTEQTSSEAEVKNKTNQVLEFKKSANDLPFESKITKINYYFKEFKNDREKFINSKNEYITNVASFLNLVYEEHRLLIENSNDKRTVDQLLIWILSANNELEQHFLFLDKISNQATNQKSTYYENYNQIGIKKYLKHLILRTSGYDPVTMDNVSKNLKLVCEVKWYSWRKWIFRSIRIKNTESPNYLKAKEIFLSDSRIHELSHNFRPFWINDKQYQIIEYCLFSEDLKKSNAA